VFWLFLGVETNAQKPAISLLPSKAETIHPEAIIDTTLTSDSLIRAIPAAMDSATMDPLGKQITVGPAKYNPGFREHGNDKFHPLLGMRNNLWRIFIHVIMLNI
jgi:hypothetical protein